MSHAVKVFDQVGDLESTFLAPRAAALAMQADVCRLDQLSADWERTDERIHSTKGFFDFVAVHVSKANGREIAGWKQPMIKEMSVGVVVLITHRHDGVVQILVRAKAEPGNRGYPIEGSNSRVLLAPAIQFSMANLQNHRDKVPLAKLVISGDAEPTVSIPTEETPQDGGRFYEKVNVQGRLDVDDAKRVSIDEEIGRLSGGAEDFAWITLDVLREVRKRGLNNPYLLASMALLV